MAPSQALLLLRGTITRRSCLIVWPGAFSPAQRRAISTGWLRKTDEALADWEKRAKEVKDGARPNFWDMLEERGYVKDTAGSRETIRELMRLKRVSAYVGIDPTASSLHVGHLLPLMPLFWMYLHGYGAFTLLGGSTVKIGDPTGRLQDRDPIASADLAMNLTKMHFQLKKLWMNVEAQARRYGYEKEWAWTRAIENNNVWWNKTPMLDVLRRVGRSMRIGTMLSRETVKRKMTEGDGVSFAEFCYPVMQGWDWWMLFQKRNVQMQIGGSDQYGNIVAGVDILKAARASEPDPAKRLPTSGLANEPVGFTVPLLTDSSGVKFGKSAGNAVWLDNFMTTPFDLYGYFMRRPDDDVEKLLRLFTFMPMDTIEKVMAKQREDPSKRAAQHRLAYEVLMLVHGEEAAKAAEAQHRMMYGGGVVPQPEPQEPGSEYLAKPGPTVPNNAPRPDMILPKSLIMGESIARILFATGLATSIKDGHRLASQEAVYIGAMPGWRKEGDPSMNPSQLTWSPVKMWFPQETQRYIIDDKLLLLRKGKHNVRAIELVSDEEYKASGQKYPGQPFTGRLRMFRQSIKALKDGTTTAIDVRKALRQAELEDEKEDQKKDLLQFPEEKSDVHKKLESQLEGLLQEAEAKEATRKTSS
ncbi:mitochondrial tyrosine--tRNA ligase [Staphylotrichum tortipilum]|uniref:Tyrosine--tRNA ligase n=1 Tax=Staphylotrichum tortipilum TaxID=2831512 RepID=A0AAN6MEW0_9PEZI|nr:mitochondrial tyrosine--tRNA ligase [Staphylotrichum longicolle]